MEPKVSIARAFEEKGDFENAIKTYQQITDQYYAENSIAFKDTIIQFIKQVINSSEIKLDIFKYAAILLLTTLNRLAEKKV